MNQASVRIVEEELSKVGIPTLVMGLDMGISGPVGQYVLHAARAVLNGVTMRPPVLETIGKGPAVNVSGILKNGSLEGSQGSGLGHSSLRFQEDAYRNCLGLIE